MATRLALDAVPTAVVAHGRAMAASRIGRPVILVDGGSGAGKSSLADAIARVWAEAGLAPLQIVRLDDIYSGWQGLAAASAAVASTLLATTDPGYRRWDWLADGPADWQPIDPERPILVEGCGAITPESAARATLTIWLDLPADERKRRALARDGDAFAPHWDEWAQQEEQHWAIHRPQELANLTVRP